ncbi:MAG: ATP-binding protein [Candidatus Binatia bacterium]
MIDDSPEDRLILRRYLGLDPAYEYEIWDTASAEAGLALSQSLHPDCIVVDYKLPDFDGGEFLRRLRAHEGFMPCGVIVLSGDDNETVIIDSLRSGAHDYLFKGRLNATGIWEALTQAISRANLERGIVQQHRSLLQRNQELEWKNQSLEQSVEGLQAKSNELEDIIQKRTEELNNANNTLTMQALVLQNMIEGVSVADEFATLVFVNTALEKMFGYQPGELVGQGISILNAGSSDEKNKVQRKIFDHLALVGEWRGEIQNRTKTGDPLTTYARTSKLTINGKNYFVSVQEDITERRRIERELQDRERLANIGSTSVRLTHEIGNRLNGISTSLQLLERQLAKQSAPKDRILSEIVNDLGDETFRLTTVLQDLRTLATPHHLYLQTIDLLMVIQNILQAQERQLTAAGIHVETSTAATAVLVQADQQKLFQVFRNLLDNAVEAMPQGGVLTITTVVKQEKVRVEIQDTGPGVPLDVNIWEPFVTNKPGGTGLGLTVAQLLVAAHNGALSCVSPPGQGATFLLELPIASSAQENDSSPISTELPTPQQSSLGRHQSQKASR